MGLVVVGDVDPAEVVRAAWEVLPRESGPAIPRDYGREEDLAPHMARIEDRMEVAMPTFLLGFKCPPVPEGPDRMRLDILGDLACDVLMGESSPLFTRLYSQGLINVTFDSAYDLLPCSAAATATPPRPCSRPFWTKHAGWSGRGWTRPMSSGSAGPASARPSRA